jgi:mRNA-degrading endonuclease RelE of RelBE toxin-antitoxin system
MKWGLVLSNSAKRSLRRAPRDNLSKLNEVFDELCADPYLHDTKLLKGLNGAFRRRAGSWRILFKLDVERHLIVVTEVVRRGSHSY